VTTAGRSGGAQAFDLAGAGNIAGRGRVLRLVGVSGGVGGAGDGGTEAFELAAAGGEVGVGTRADLLPSRGHGCVRGSRRWWNGGGVRHEGACACWCGRGGGGGVVRENRRGGGRHEVRRSKPK
jgi:hypothetical protein